MAAPTFVTSYADAYGNGANSTLSASVSVENGDILVVCVSTEDAAFTFGGPAGGGLIYDLASVVASANFSWVSVWTARSASIDTFPVSVSKTAGASHWSGMTILRFADTNGVGASNSGTGTGGPSLALTTGAANSAIVAISGDWNAVDGASRTWRTVNGITPTAGNGLERTYARDAAAGTAYVGYWSDAGAAGSKTVGLSDPVGQKYSIVAVEVLGTGGAATSLPPRRWRRRPSGLLVR